MAQSSSQDTTLTPKEVKAALDTVKHDIKILKNVKLTGFVQFRYEYEDTSKSAGSNFVTGTPNPNDNNFYVRRGRVKFTYQPSTSSDYVFQFDGAKNTFVVKDAFMDLYHKFGKQKFTLTAGQFNIPFGYEIEEADPKNDFVERSFAEGKLFNGERDRGVNLTYNAPKYIQINMGLLQGYGIQDNTFTWFDPTKNKDFVGRIKANLGKLNVGFSTYFGHTFVPGSPAAAEVTTWTDANGNGVPDSGEVKTTAAKAATSGVEYEKNRAGMDAQLELKLIPDLGSTIVKGEFYGARDKNLTEQGWYVRLSQALGKQFAAAIRYDFWDPNTNDTTSDRGAGKFAPVGTYGFVAWYAFDANSRLSLEYDIPQLMKGSSPFSESTHSVKANKLTFQFQYAL